MAESDERELSRKWQSFWENKRSVHAPLVGPAQQLPKRAESTTPFCLTMLDACGIPLPPSVLGEVAAATTDVSVEHRFHLTFFDSRACRFFGGTYVSPTFKGTTGGNLLARTAAATSETVQHDSVVFKHPVYFHSSTTDPRCLAVVEFVLAVKDSAGVAVREVSAGWALFCPFGNPARLRDVQDGEAARVSGATEQIWVGSPRCLCSLVSRVSDDDVSSISAPFLLSL